MSTVVLTGQVQSVRSDRTVEISGTWNGSPFKASLQVPFVSGQPDPAVEVNLFDTVTVEVTT